MVSVIIPVYNVEKYLEEALESVINQSLKDIEIIVINDGSTDRSLRIIKEYANKDKRIKIINQKNQGLSIARNMGIEKAKGKYICFMDSDDYIDLKTLEICYKKCEKYKLEMVCFDAFLFSSIENFKYIANYDRSFIEVNKIFTGREFTRLCLKNKKNIVSSCLYFFKREILYKEKLKFYSGIQYEDNLFSTILFDKVERLMYINKQFYFRRYRENSITTQKATKKKLEDLFKVSDELINYRNEQCTNRISSINLKKITSGILGSILYMSLTNDLFKKEVIEKIKKEYKEYIDYKIILKILFEKIYIIYKKLN
ncbi:glycosyltransferase family 2 protein [Fusobacterium ulcerans]|uniref:Glycosyltransferase 2-like domain-containing protein n=1 Tax=Fusobacterium ulcerans 12-1B TaxID=457404 RepID=S2L1I9_9FUSO|nr:glycosyltransferase [Fusobacterium ulcerans]EPC09065.1 hypothetical protein HMPREF0402_04208 [Fusobacterium ulcerans 12-1B]